MAISQWPEDQRPRERLHKLGAGALADAELLAIFLRVGVRGQSAVDLGESLITHLGGNLGRLVAASQQELTRLPGLGPAKAAQLVAVMELARRAIRSGFAQQDILKTPEAVKTWLQLKLLHLTHEVFGVIWLDIGNQVLAYEELFRGTLDQTSVYPREVVKQALQHNAAAAILVHNHPGGTAVPSSADRQLTSKLKAALELIETRVLDHIIVASKEVPYSFAEHGLL